MTQSKTNWTNLLETVRNLMLLLGKVFIVRILFTQVNGQWFYNRQHSHHNTRCGGRIGNSMAFECEWRWVQAVNENEDKRARNKYIHCEDTVGWNRIEILDGG